MSEASPPKSSDSARTMRAPRVRRPSWAKLSSHQDLNVLVADLSRTGMRIIDPSSTLDLGEHVDLEIHVEGEEPFAVSGFVCRFTENGFAVQFAVAPEEAERWMVYLRHLATA